MPSRMNYWSCSKFADFIRGTRKLSAASSRDWRTWRQEAQQRHPIRYWIAEEALDWLQNFFNWPLDRLNDVRYYINNRFIIRSNALTAHARDIRPGAWCDVGSRFLPCLFNELVNFVEVEQAWHFCIWDEAAREKYEVPGWQRRWYTRWGREWRCPEAGLAYLDWASGLKVDQNMGAGPGDPEYGEPTRQALAAREIKELYMWWTQERPRRPDVYDESGWSEYCDLRRERGANFLDLEDRTEEEAEMGRTALERSQEIERAYEEEDEAMMIRLIRVRDALWT